jgi:hypothetical protein
VRVDNPAQCHKALDEPSTEGGQTVASTSLSRDVNPQLVVCDIWNAATALAVESPSTQSDHQALSCDDAFGALSLYQNFKPGKA